MHLSIPLHQASQTDTKTLFWYRFLNSLKKFGIIFLQEIKIWRLILYVLYAVFGFLVSLTVEINHKKYSLSLLKDPLLIYIVGTYLTPFPSYAVIFLMFFPSKKVMPFFGVVIIFQFFRALLI